MNSLSWLLYFAQAFDNIRSTCYNFGVFWTIVGGLSLIAWIVYRFIIVPINCFDSGGSERNAKECLNELGSKTYKSLFHLMFLSWILAGSLHLFSSVLPDRKTVTLIAASEIGEKFIKNEKVQSVFDPSLDLLRTWMEKQTLDLKQEMEQSNQPKPSPKR